MDTDEFRRARTAFDKVSAEVGGGVVFNNPDPDVEIQWWMAQYYKRAPAITSKLPSLGYEQVVGTVVRDYVKETPDIQTAIVNQAYQTVFYREATPDELNTWVPQIMAGKKIFRLNCHGPEKTEVD